MIKKPSKTTLQKYIKRNLIRIQFSYTKVMKKSIKYSLNK